MREQLAKEMPDAHAHAHPRTWGGFVGASLAAAGIVAVWFSVRLAHEILKTIPTDAAPDHTAECEALFREAFALAADLPSPSEFAASVLAHAELSPTLRATFDAALRRLYAETMMLDVPAIPADTEDLDAIRW